MYIPRLFLGSSSESLPQAETLQQLLAPVASVHLWNQSFYKPGYFTLETLIDKVSQFDFAVFLVSPEDVAEIRGRRALIARDNVLFEAGLFFGQLGRRRTLLVAPANPDFHLPSDLRGLTLVEYHGADTTSWSASLGSAASQIKEVIAAEGQRVLHPDSAQEETPVVIPDHIYLYIANQGTGKLLEVADWGTNDGERIQQWAYLGGENQQWRLEAVDDRYFWIVCKYSQKCLAVESTTHHGSDRVVQKQRAGTESEHWIFSRLEDGCYRIGARSRGDCLQITEDSAADGVEVCLKRWDGNTIQRWRLQYLL